MATNGELLGRFLRGEQLTEAEIQQLVRFANDSDDTRLKTLGILSGNTVLEKPMIRNPIWLDSPLGNYSFQMHTDLLVANNTATYITFDTFYQHGDYFFVDQTDAQIINLRYPGLNFMLAGLVEWDNNSTGYRHIAMEGFKADGTSLGSVGLHLLAPQSTENNRLPVSYVADLQALAEMVYVKFFVNQTSGGNLLLRQVLLTMYVV